MRIAVAGKGGSGKTTVAGTIARALGRSHGQVIAFDGDTNPMLGVAVGLGPEESDLLAAVRQGLDTGDTEHQTDINGILDTFGREGPDGVRVVVVNRIDQIDPGCP